MKLSGIRSFGSDDSDAQYIFFDKPFTLILGRNGCGKTTIIEALKYACSGSMPGQGVHFVRDPKLDRKVETRAQVLLTFTSAKGKDSSITRLMGSTQKLRSLTFKTLDCTVTTMDDNGKSASTSGRHTDIDDLMVRLLGVSKPILNYVIFCHQEDSYWPLEEGKKVKERFDEIFDSTRYQKAMEEVRKIRNNVLKELKVYNTALGFLRDNVMTARQKRKELDSLQKKFNDAEEHIVDLENRISSVRKEYKEWQRRHDNYRGIQKERDDVERRLLGHESVRDGLKAVIVDVWSGTKDELTEVIKEFDEQLDGKQEAVNQIKRDQEKIEQSRGRITKEISAVQTEIGKLEGERADQQNITADRNRKLSVLAEVFGLPALEEGATDSEVDELRERVRKELNNLANSINLLKQKQEKEQSTLQERINKCREVKTKLEAEISLKKDTIESHKEDIQKLDRELGEVSVSARRKVKVEEELKKCRHDREEVAESENSQALASEIEHLKKDCKELDERQRQLLAEAKQLVKLQEAQKELQKAEEKHKECLNSISKLRSKNYEFISDHLKDSDDGSIKQDLGTLIQTFRKELDVSRNSLNDKKCEAAAIDQERNFKITLLQKKKEELQANSELVRAELLGSKNIDEALKKIENEINAAQDNRGLYASSSLVYESYIKRLGKPKPACPLCHRCFDKEEEVTELIENIKTNQLEFPAKVAEAEQKLSKFKERQKKLMTVKALQVANEKLDTEIRQLSTELESLDESQNVAYGEIPCCEVFAEESEHNLRRAESIQSDVFELDRCHKECKQLARQIEKLKRENPDGSGSRSYDEAMAEHQIIQDELSTKLQEKDDQEERQRKYVKKLNELDRKINDLEADRLKITSLLQNEEKIREQKSKLSELKECLEKELERLEESLTPALEDKAKAENTLALTRVQHKKIIQEKEKEMGDRDKQMTSFKTVHDSLNKFEGKNLGRMIQHHKDKLLRLEGELNNLQTKLEALCEKSKKIESSLETHERRKKEFLEHLKIMELDEKIVEQKKILKQVEEKLGSSDMPGIEKKCDDLHKQYSDLDRQVNECRGKQHGLKENINSRKEELRKPELKNAEQSFKEKFSQVQVSSRVERDLQKYYNALDFSMQTFHKDRMSCINKFVREFWRVIYKGNDIDYIEIKTDESAAAAATKDTDKRRTYSYRVVQVKNGTEIEMRGRCSAGQKVLACLIIRMALAETFSANCGILTLDEPTTNLDKANIESLCQAISDIVSDHEGRKTFQLIVITHDNEFLNTMSNLDFLHHYWEVSRDKQ